MDDDTIEDNEVFEIGDFTVVTPLEQFITLIEGALQDWELTGRRPLRKYNKNVMKTVNWSSRSKVLKFHDVHQLTMTHYSPIIPEGGTQEAKVPTDKAHLGQPCLDMMSPELDFVHQNNIVSLYGITEFVVFSPVDPRDDNISTEDDVQYLRSAFRCASQASDCNIPMFVQFGEIDRQLYFGVSIDGGTCTTFEGALLRRGQSHHLNLSGLLAMFKSHVTCPTIRDQEDIRVSVQFELEKKLNEAGIFNPDIAATPFKLERFAIGAENSPLESLCLLASWPNNCEDVLNENHLYSDLDPLNAFEWAAFVRFEPVDGEMARSLCDVLEIPFSKRARKTASEVMGLSEAPGVMAFSQLTEGGGVNKISIGSPSITNPGGLASDFALMPLEEDEMARWINAIFRMTPSQEEFPEIKDVEFRQKIESLCGTSVSAPCHSVGGRLSRAFYHLSINSVHPKNAHVQLWSQFVKTLRKKYENGEDVIDSPDLKEPNLLRCLFNQKLDMLQCCINTRRIRHQWYDDTKQFGNDEFFDAEEDLESSEKEDTPPREESDSNGRLEQHENLTLIEHPDTPLYTFITQNACPMTEDMAQAHQEYLEKLSEEGRVQAQLASLRSDMQGFKAANPQGKFEDFIRWHSPKDWIEDEQRVSDRFQLPGNVWTKCWEESLPVVVVNQKRLFNETSVAEEILSMFESATMTKIAEWLQPILFTGAAAQLLERAWKIRELFSVDALVDTVLLATRTKRRDDYLEALREIKKVEKDIMRYESVEQVLSAQMNDSRIVDLPSPNELSQFIIKLIIDWKSKRDFGDLNIVSKGVTVIGAANSSIGETIKRVMETNHAEKGQKTMPYPTTRQYVLRWCSARPGEGSRPVPQRMFASLQEDTFRLAGSFTEDTQFV